MARRVVSSLAADESSTSVVVRCPHTPGALEQCLRVFRLASINITRIESRPREDGQSFDIFLDVAGSRAPVSELAAKGFATTLLGPRTVPWFPRSVADLDAFAKSTLDAGAQLESDHPGFNDADYRARRAAITANAQRYRQGERIPEVEYTPAETRTWGVVYDELKKRYPRLACDEYNGALRDLEACGLYSRERIPQLWELSGFLEERTGFALRPVAGLLSSRDFLNGLAHRVFHSTQYMRHPSRPLYTPEPDAVHELMGHAPMLCNEQFAAFSQELGLASLGASDNDVKRLATCYWFSVEFGLVRQHGGLRAFGAGLLSSFGELEYACESGKPEIRAWDPFAAAELAYPITDYQPVYFAADSLEHLVQSMRSFCEEGVQRPFRCRYDAKNQRVVTVDRMVRRQGSLPA